MFSRSSTAPAACWGNPDDALSSVLRDIRLSGSSFCRAEVGAPWGMNVPQRPFAAFHFVAGGACWLRRGKAETLELQTGDLVLLPRGDAHVLADRPDGNGPVIDTLPREKLSETASVLRHGGNGSTSIIVCGAVQFEGLTSEMLMDVLPRVVLVRTAEERGVIDGVMTLFAQEALASRPGTLTMMTRLADVVVLYAVRSWLEQSSKATPGWLGALRDAQIGRAVALVHERPEEPWSVGLLADSVHMSRSAFSERFRSLVGIGPMSFVARLRMHRATELLQAESATVAEVATRLGYESEHAFSRAFKRHMGVPPGAARRAGQAPRASERVVFPRRA